MRKMFLSTVSGNHPVIVDPGRKAEKRKGVYSFLYFLSFSPSVPELERAFILMDIRTLETLHAGCGTLGIQNHYLLAISCFYL